jgi:hypothetical protein
LCRFTPTQKQPKKYHDKNECQHNMQSYSTCNSCNVIRIDRRKTQGNANIEKKQCECSHANKVQLIIYTYVGMVTLMGYIAFLCILAIRHPICFQKCHARETRRAITNGQSREIGNIGYTKHKTKTYKAKTQCNMCCTHYA